MNPIRLILVHLDGAPAGVARLRAARALAEQQGAAVRAVFAVTPMVVAAPYAFPPGVEFAALMAECDQDRRALARAQFDGEAGRDGRIEWVEAEGEPGWALSQAALCADLLVLGQREDPSRRNVPADFVESVLMQSGKPALVLPYIETRPGPPRVALVAWKNTRESARALSDALPLLQRAEQVHVALWPEHEEQERPDEGAPDPLAYLQRHGVRARAHHGGKARGLVGELLLSLAADLGADLLVMGCYGHGRAREWVMGGASRTVLSSMTLPVLMVH